MADISFKQFDSASFATIEASIKHSEDNPFIIDRFSDKYSAQIDGVSFIISEPSNILSSFIWMLDPYITTQPLPSDERFMPERTAKRLYGSHDFWYVPMLLNSCASVTEYEFSSIKVLTADQLYRVEAFLRRAKNQVTVYQEDRDVIYR
jgi:hypothetical protein